MLYWYSIFFPEKGGGEEGLPLISHMNVLFCPSISIPLIMDKVTCCTATFFDDITAQMPHIF